jgi:hypothetical protein
VNIKATWQVVGIVLAFFFGFPSLYVMWSSLRGTDATPVIVYWGLGFIAIACLIWGGVCAYSLHLNNVHARALRPALLNPIPPARPPSTDDLQFSNVEPAAVPSAADPVIRRSCVICRRVIESIYFAMGDKTVCQTCKARLEAPLAGSSVRRVAEATFRGLGAGLLGAIAWFAIRRLAHVEIGLVAIVVGFMVGKAVRKASGGRGGRGYQILAVVLTYSCIAANYMPDIFEGAMKKAHLSQNH